MELIPVINYVKNNEILEEICLSTNKKVCFLAFFDGKENGSSKKLFDKSFEIYKEMHKKHYKKPFNFGWVNATCQENFSNKFNINSASLPNLIAFIPSKNVYANLIGTFEKENLDIFVNKLIKGQINLYKIDKNLVTLDNLKCEDMIEIKEHFEEDEILKEILEEKKVKSQNNEIENEGEIKKKNNKKKKEL